MAMVTSTPCVGVMPHVNALWPLAGTADSAVTADAVTFAPVTFKRLQLLNKDTAEWLNVTWRHNTAPHTRSAPTMRGASTHGVRVPAP